MAILNKVNYVDQDFSTAVAQVKQFLDDNYPDEFNDYVNSNLGLALIDIIAYAEQNLLWYMNRKVTDLYFPTAITPQSVSKIARMLGYKSAAATAAEVPVSITLSKGPYTFPVQINKGFQFQGPNNQLWEYRGEVPVLYDPGQLTKDNILLSQGQTVVNSFVSTGENNQFFQLLSVPVGKFVESASVVVKVDGTEWTEQPIIPFTNENNYETNLLTFPPIVKFGDGVQGNIPPTGSAIQVSYVICDGFRGRIVSNSITAPVFGLVAQFQTIPITISQVSGSVGGDDPEDLRSITTNAPLFQRTQDRAITKGDYDFIGNNFLNVARSDAQIVRGISGDVTFNYIAGAIINSVSAASQGISGAILPYVANFNTAVSGIFKEVDIFGVSAVTSISGETASISASVDTINSLIHTDLAAMRTNIQPFYDAAVTAITDIDKQSSALVDNLGIAVDIKNASINGLLDSIISVVSGAETATVSSYVSIIRTTLTSLKSSVVSAATSTNVIIDTDTNTVQTNLDDIIDAVEGVSGTIDIDILPQKNSIAANLVSIVHSISGVVSGFESAVSGYEQIMFDSLTSINNQFVSGTVGLLNTVSGYVDAFLAHADEHLVDSCNANKVQVKVLGKDANRNYVSPLQTTLDSLKIYLEARKDITHTIDVVTGILDVIEADITITVRVSDNAVEDDVVASISDALRKADVAPLGILIERQFNKPLYIWEIDGAIRSTVTNPDQAIKYMNIVINGPAKYLDHAGNLITPQSSVIQAGTITIKKLPRFTKDGS